LTFSLKFSKDQENSLYEEIIEHYGSLATGGEHTRTAVIKTSAIKAAHKEEVTKM
jgi:hypothetical protein